jgi:hypothetical protein
VVGVCVVKQIGAIGFVVVTALLDSTVTKTRVQNINGDVISDSVTGSYRCFSDTLNRTSLRITSLLSTQAGCWPFTTFIYSMVRSSNIGDQCINAPRALKFLQFLHDQTSTTAESAIGAFTSDNADLAADSSASSISSSLQRSSVIAEQLGALWALPYQRALVQARLNSVTCNGETILVTLPIDHRISTEVESTMLGISILGVCIIILILCFIYFFHLRSAIKASSPIFLIATIIGMLFLFTSGPLLTRSIPTSRFCESGWWMMNIGFYLTFGPLFAKAWYVLK